ncbi:putative transcription factor WD40-like family [Rosa chinensis]|uniref:Putative transcription factor WD40-like family n=1 Tax=Rosa chinensis TaxID=74649 RepID=A0A2P6RM54_ROSCH|nr:periodic tryptophan protein 1 homolog [Rosa chinensis]PRQ47519.1 putative transcription factor WD40-like family [Rosa chinensis]
MISAVSWVPKGVSKPVPAVAEPPTQEEIDELIKSGILDKSGDGGGNDEDDEGEMEVETTSEGGEVSQALEVAKALGRASKVTKSGSNYDDITEGLKELDMDNYDEEDNDGIDLFSGGYGDLYYPSNDMDPYLKKDKDDDEDSEDSEDMTINPNDAVIVCARNEDDISQLEIWLYTETEDGEPDVYVHHDIIISAFPLCTAWLDCPLKGGDKGNFIAVGLMGEPTIEIWDLDIIDEVQPCVVLGGIAEKKKKKGKKTSIKYKEDSHTDSVLGLAWNKEYRNILASASADKQVKIWDVATGKCNITMEHHTDKVQAVAWNHFAPQVLLSGSFDHSIVLKDGRVPTHSGYKWTVTADVESLAWDPHTEHSFVVSLEDGTVQGFDIRAATSAPTSESKPSFTLHAHDKAVCGISYNPLAPNLLATGSTDKMVKLWDLSNNQPSCIASMNPKAGAVFSISFSQDNPFLLAMGGSKGKLEVWDTSYDAAVAQRFGSYIKKSRPQSGA